jgi:poly(3-hydroxybutyrate) depolymerase
MKTRLLSIFMLATTFSAVAQDPCTTGRYASDVFTTVTATSNVVYGQNTSFSNSNTTLKLDFYEPAGDTATVRPLIVWVHGGSFLGGSKTDADMVALSNAFAKKGYICASIDYRTGFFPIDSANSVKAVVRAVQDLRASIRFFYRDRKEGINQFKVDTNNIFIGGSSAGAITCLHLAYLDRSCEINGYVPNAALTSLGGLEGNSGHPCYSSKVNGVINLCGALAQYGWLEAGNLPLCSLHGTTDGTVKYNRGVVNPGVPLMYLDGSRMIHEQALAVGVQSNFYTFNGAGHVPYLGGSSAAVAYMDTTVKFVRDYLVERLGCSNAALQPANAPAQTATLYPFTPCTGDNPISFCTGSGIVEIEGSVVTVYPNPTTDKLTVTSAQQIIEVELIDLFGNSIWRNQYNANEVQLTNSMLSRGIYLLRVTQEDGSMQTMRVLYE